MSAAPGPKRAAMLALQARGFDVREAWCLGEYDGLHAIKQVGPHRIEVYAGNADDGDYGDNHYAPVVYVDDRRVASAPTVERAARIAEMRACLARAAVARATGSAS